MRNHLARDPADAKPASRRAGPLRFRLAVAVTGLLLLAGCGNPAVSMWEDYLQRIERLTETELAPSEPFEVRRYPRRRALAQPIPELRTGMRRYFNLARCDMMGLVSERNSVLSRVQEDSLRLAYELRFLHRAEDCLAQDRLADEPEQEQWLRQVTAQKRAMLPDLYWNVTLAGDELRGLFPLAGRATAGGSIADARQVTRAVEHLAALAGRLDGPTLPDDAATLEADLQTLYRSDAGGQLLHAMAVAEDGLNRAATMLEETEPEHLCPEGRATREARYLNNVFNEIYAADVQPWLAALWRDMDRLAPALTRLHRSQPVDNRAFEEWMTQHFSGNNSLQARTRQAMERHTAAWQRLLDHCDMAPAPSPGGRP